MRRRSWSSRCALIASLESSPRLERQQGQLGLRAGALVRENSAARAGTVTGLQAGRAMPCRGRAPTPAHSDLPAQSARKLAKQAPPHFGLLQHRLPTTGAGRKGGGKKVHHPRPPTQLLPGRGATQEARASGGP